MAEDGDDVILEYKMVLEGRGHIVTFTSDDKACLKEYENSFGKFESSTKSSFDVVILDIKMSKNGGLQAGKEIIGLNPSQRIIFCSDLNEEDFANFTKDFADLTKNFSNKIIDVLQKPFEPSDLATAVEDEEMYEELQNFYSSVEKNNEIDPTDPEIKKQLSA